MLLSTTIGNLVYYFAILNIFIGLVVLDHFPGKHYVALKEQFTNNLCTQTAMRKWNIKAALLDHRAVGTTVIFFGTEA